jgi:hypothetical protein
VPFCRYSNLTKETFPVFFRDNAMSFRTSIVAVVATVAACGGKVLGVDHPLSDAGIDANQGSGRGGAGGSGAGGGAAGDSGAGGSGTSGSGTGGSGTGGSGTGGSGATSGASGSSGGPALGDGAPTAVDAGSAPIDGGSGQHRKRLAFSRGGSNGNLGGLAGADRLCQRAAPSGVWKAWLSDATTNAIDRIADVGPWYTMNGLLAFKDKAQLTQTPSAIIEFDQTGAQVAASSYWTGTRVGGTSADANCNDWTSAAENAVGVWGDGRQLRGAPTWTEASSPPASCNGAINLICIEQ